MTNGEFTGRTEKKCGNFLQGHVASIDSRRTFARSSQQNIKKRYMQTRTRTILFLPFKLLYTRKNLSCFYIQEILIFLKFP